MVLVFTKTGTAGPWHMRFFRLGKIRMFQNRMTDIQESRREGWTDAAIMLCKLNKSL